MGAAHRSKPTNEMIGLLVFIMTGNLSSLSGNIREFGRVGVYVSVKRVREKGGGGDVSLYLPRISGNDGDIRNGLFSRPHSFPISTDECDDD